MGQLVLKLVQYQQNMSQNVLALIISGAISVIKHQYVTHQIRVKMVVNVSTQIQDLDSLAIV
jgi:hypothetical protein